MNVTTLSDNALLDEFTDWFRIGRDEGGLLGEEREHFQDVLKEISRRKLLDPKNLFQDKL